MVEQIRGQQPGDMHHESPHDMLIIKIKKSLPKIITKSYSVPKSDEQIEDFISHMKN